VEQQSLLVVHPQQLVKRERGPQLAGGTTVVARRPPPAARQADDRGNSKYATVDEMTEVTRREKERGPQLMGVAVVAHPSPAARTEVEMTD
jgi:hypothetical protein